MLIVSIVTMIIMVAYVYWPLTTCPTLFWMLLKSVLLPPDSTAMTQRIQLSPIYKEGNRGTGRLSNLPKVTQITPEAFYWSCPPCAGTGSPAFRAPRPCAHDVVTQRWRHWALRYGLCPASPGEWERRKPNTSSDRCLTLPSEWLCCSQSCIKLPQTILFIQKQKVAVSSWAGRRMYIGPKSEGHFFSLSALTGFEETAVIHYWKGQGPQGSWLWGQRAKAPGRTRLGTKRTGIKDNQPGSSAATALSSCLTLDPSQPDEKGKVPPFDKTEWSSATGHLWSSPCSRKAIFKHWTGGNLFMKAGVSFFKNTFFFAFTRHWYMWDTPDNAKCQ